MEKQITGFNDVREHCEDGVKFSSCLLGLDLQDWRIKFCIRRYFNTKGTFRGWSEMPGEDVQSLRHRHCLGQCSSDTRDKSGAQGSIWMFLLFLKALKSYVSEINAE